MRIARVLTVSICFAGIWFWACGQDGPLQPNPEPEEDVSIINGQFVPSQLTIAVGTRVRWTNNDNSVAVVESGTPMNPTTAFNSPNIQAGSSWPHLFNQVGVFSYYSSLSGATGRITVQ